MLALVLVTVFTAALGFTAGPIAVAQVQDSAKSAEVTKDDILVNADIVPTFFRRPMALTPEDLKAAKVDVAMFGAPVGWMTPAGAGNHWGPQFVRAQFGNGMYGSETTPLSANAHDTMLEPFSMLNVVDHGDSAPYLFNIQRSISELRRVTREIAETGTIPFAIGGDHSVPTGTYRGIADVYGYKKVALVHFDAHLDFSYDAVGSYVHSASHISNNSK